MTENFLNLERGNAMQVQQAQRVKENPKRPTPRDIIIKMPNFIDTEKILKTARKKQKVT